MLSIFQSIILGVVQGLTEFLPVSSSAHLIIIPAVFKFPDPGLTFDVALHLGTALAIVGYYWKDWINLTKKGLTDVKSSEGKLFWIIIISSIPAASAGYFFEKLAETSFRQISIISISLIVVAVFLLIADVKGKKAYKIENISLTKGFLIGIAQAIAIIPGISRSGITMTMALALGFKREDSANFSFLLAAPIILGAGLLKLKHVNISFFTPNVIIGIIVSAISGFIAIHFLLKYLKKASFLPFCIYRVILALLLLFGIKF